MINLEVVYVTLLNKCERRTIVSTNVSRIWVDVYTVERSGNPSVYIITPYEGVDSTW